MKYMRWIWRFWKPHTAWVWILLSLTLLSSAVALAWPFILGHIIDIIKVALGDEGKDISSYPLFIQSALQYVDSLVGEVNIENHGSMLWTMIWILALVGFARTLTHLYPGFRAMINLKLGMDMRSHYFSAIIEKGHRFFQKFRTGDLVTRLTDDIEGFPKIGWFCCSGIFRAVESASKFFICLAFMMIMNWKLSLLSLTPLPFMFLIFYFVRIALSKRAEELQKIISRTNEALEAAFSGVRILKAFRGEDHQTSEFSNLLAERIDTELNLMKLRFGLHNLYMGIQFVGQIIILVIGGMMVIRRELSLGEFYAFYMYITLIFQPLLDIPHLFTSSRQAFVCIDREIEIEETPGGTEDAFTGIEPIGRVDSIELKNVNFRFEDNLPLALDDISLTIKRGEKAAVVGVVGSGKSTLIKLAAGLILPNDGELLINGRSITDYDIDSYHTRVGYIPQESTLFSESVIDNVIFGRDISEDSVKEALDMAQVLKEMESLPDGLKEVLGQKGLTVSGGQKQRLAIARALAGKPDLLLMDDCTASLDAENERRFWNMFAEKFPETSCLIVTHRLATARRADVIYVLYDGKIVGKGTHLELLQTCEQYQNFLTRDELEAAMASAKSA